MRSVAAALLGLLLLSVPGWAQSSVPAETETLSSRAALIERVMPAVVNVSTALLQHDSGASSAHTVSGSNWFPSAHGFGSGFVIDGSGLIVTNRHVVENAVRITVTFPDQTTLPARIVGHLSTADVALLQVTPAKPLASVQWGDSDKLRLGDDVIAIGNPLGLGGSVSRGIVSGLNRDIRTTPFDDFIQTDAAINHGNSGGPLFDMHGRVIGINTAIFSPTDTSGSIGISFALPSQVAAFIVEETRRYGRVRAGSIGVRLQSVTPDVANALNLSNSRGAIILGLDHDSSAAAAGLHRGDVITDVGSDKPSDARALLRAVALAPLDQPLLVKVWRQGQELTFDPVVRLYEAPRESEIGEEAAVAREKFTPLPDAGLKMAEITPALRTKYKLSPDIKGVLVTGVAPYSAADLRGIFPGDVVLEVDQHNVTAPAEVDARVAADRERHARYTLLLITGPGGDRFVTLPLDPGVKEPQPAEAERR